MMKNPSEWVVLKSSMIHRVLYFETTKLLVLELHSGSTYAYTKVPKEIYGGLLSASSAGAYFGSKIRDNYDYQELDTEEVDKLLKRYRSGRNTGERRQAAQKTNRVR